MSHFVWEIVIDARGRRFTYRGETYAAPGADAESILPKIIDDLPAECKASDSDIVSYRASKTN
ncbi:hypothetical protein ACIRU8_39375 [Streptomyces sp. NPDC101175]|uniref:hypothetical protein n=1 Tax=Streptomyces sp. NPDC101175 TaxID=3366123 RepID=UPI003837D8D5